MVKTKVMVISVGSVKVVSGVGPYCVYDKSRLVQFNFMCWKHNIKSVVV